MKLLVVVLLSVIILGCGTQMKTSEGIARQPQNSEFDETEVYSDDAVDLDAYEFQDQDFQIVAARKGSTLFESFCKKSKPSDIKVNSRVVTLNNGQYVSGQIKESYDNGTTFLVSADYGPHSVYLKSMELKRDIKEICKALKCEGTKSKKVYGLFQVGKNYYTGHVREVFENGVVRFVNDLSKEQFSTVDLSYLEIKGSKLKFKNALFLKEGVEIQGQIRRVFEKELLVIKYGNKLYVRKNNEVKIQD